jgi:hypothetical protein
MAAPEVGGALPGVLKLLNPAALNRPGTDDGIVGTRSGAKNSPPDRSPYKLKARPNTLSSMETAPVTTRSRLFANVVV